MANNAHNRLLEDAERGRGACSTSLLHAEYAELFSLKRIRTDWHAKTKIPDATGLDVLQLLPPVVIKIKFTHLVDPQTGLGFVNAARRSKLVKAMNKAFLGSGISFKSAKAQTVFNSQYCYDMEDPATTAIVKQKYHYNPDNYLNIYTAALSSELGWATFPVDYVFPPNNPNKWMDGVVVWHGVLPGGLNTQFNQGKRVVHEVGHWLGLLHTFHNGCAGNGDDVTDTPAHSGPNTGVPPDGANNGACNPLEQAPIHNFMNYTDDVCMTHFTPEQIEKMRKLMQLFRPGL